MVHGRSSGSGGSTAANLPRLDPGATTNQIPSASLRGRYHKKVPEISNQPLNTLLPILKDGAEHPQPYYITQNIVLKIPDTLPVWKESSDTIELLEFWNSNKKFRENYVAKLVEDFIYSSVTKVVSSTIMEEKTTSKDDSKFLGKVEELLTSIIFDLTAEICWESLWDSARKLKIKEINQLEDVYTYTDPDPGMLTTLRQNYKNALTPEQGAKLLNYNWEELLYHTNRYMQRGSLSENYAIVKLQEQIITQVAANLFLNEALNFITKEMNEVDENEKFEHPPRKRPDGDDKNEDPDEEDDAEEDEKPVEEAVEDEKPVEEEPMQTEE